MTAYVARLGAFALIARNAAKLYAATRSLDAWLAARAKAVAERNQLMSMSARQLRDIGIDAPRERGFGPPRLGDWP